MSNRNIAKITRFNLFHGSTEDLIDTIIEEKQFKIKERDNHWLGNGVYFFIDDASKAFWWARNTATRMRRKNKIKDNTTTKIKEETIIFFEASIERDNLIDLDTESDRDRFDDFIKDLEELGVKLVGKKKNPDGKLSQKEALCLLIDTYVGYYNNIDAIKYTFSDVKNQYEYLDSKYGITNNGVQLSLFNQSILDFEKCIKQKRSEWNVG